MKLLLAALPTIATALSVGGSSWRSAATRDLPLPGEASLAATVGELCRELSWPEDGPPPDFCLLTVPQEHSKALQQVAAEAARELSAGILIGVLGMAIGGSPTHEYMKDGPALSLLAGRWPPATAVRPFIVSGERFPTWSEVAGGEESFLIFADPFSPCTQVTSILNDLCPGSVVAGGLSCPPLETVPSLALYIRGAQCRTLPPGSLIGLSVSGDNVEFHTATAQGAAPVGPTFLVTNGDGGNLVTELDGQPALQRLQEVAEEASGSDPRVLKLIQRALLVGVTVGCRDAADGTGAARGGASAPDGPPPPSESEPERDFLIRQVLGVTNEGGLYVGDRVEVGSTRLQFHVRDEQAAHDELNLLLGRYRVERQFSGRFAEARPLGCLLFSCNGRGTNMYKEEDHDTKVIVEALGGGGGELAVGGFFCNGEIGPIGVKGVTKGKEASTFVHGFTSVVTVIYDMTQHAGDAP